MVLQGLALLLAHNNIPPPEVRRATPEISVRVVSPGLLLFQMAPPSVLPKSIFCLWFIFGFLQAHKLALLVFWTKLPILFSWLSLQVAARETL